MPTTTASLGHAETITRTVGRFAVTFDSAADPATEYAYSVRDAADLELIEGFDTEAEALADAEEREAELVAEEAEAARDERMADARERIEALLRDCEDEAMLAKIEAMLAG